MFMKKLLILFLVMLTSLNAFSQKKYVTVTFYENTAKLSGDIPASMKKGYTNTDFQESRDYMYWAGDLLNLLASNGFEVEQMNTYVTGTSEITCKTIYLLSSPSKQSTSDIIHGVETDDTEVYEVARYNLQGLPVNEKDKGIQIIVYSNFTTKTIIQE